MAITAVFLTWRAPGTEEPGGALPRYGLQEVDTTMAGGFRGG